MKKRFSLFFVFVLVLSTFLAACGDKDAKKEDKKDAKEDVKQVLNLPETSEIPSMDSSLATDAVSFNVMNNVLEGLYRLGEDGQTPTEGVAEKHEVSEDGKTYTFTLRSDAKWSNGEPVTANDFVYAWKRAVNPKTAAEYAYIMFDVKNAAKINNGDLPVDQLGVKAVDEKTLEVQLETAVPYFISLTSFATFYPLNEKFVTEQGSKHGTEANTTLYNGPFTLSEWKHEQSFQLKKNPNYWDAKTVKLEEVNYSIIKDTATGVNLYETEQIDRIALDAEFVDKYKSSEEFSTYQEPTVFFLRLNQKDKLLKNKKARQAINMGWDKQLFVDTILNNGSIPANFLVPENFVQGPEDKKDFRDANGDLVKTDKAEATKLWKEALKEVGVDSYKLVLLNYDSESAKKTGEYLKEELEQTLPGLTVDIKPQPFQQKLDLETKGDYQFSYAGWGPDYPDPMTFVDMFVTDGTHNQMDYSNPKFDDLVKKSKTELMSDLPKRWESLQEAEKILFEDAAIAPMFQRGRAYLQRPYAKNIVKHNFGGDFSFKWAYIEK
jgi:oligopeptide transport system substrate-binding protein